MVQGISARGGRADMLRSNLEICYAKNKENTEKKYRTDIPSCIYVMY
jgi:hypothetical protein